MNIDVFLLLLLLRFYAIIHFFTVELSRASIEMCWWWLKVLTTFFGQTLAVDVLGVFGVGAGVCVLLRVGDGGWLVSSGDISSVDDSKCSRIESLERIPDRMGHNTSDICMGARYNANANANANCTMSMNNMIHSKIHNSTDLNTFWLHFYLFIALIFQPTRAYTHNKSAFARSLCFSVFLDFGGKETWVDKMLCGFSTPYKRFSRESFLFVFFFASFLEWQRTKAKTHDTLSRYRYILYGWRKEEIFIF